MSPSRRALLGHVGAGVLLGLAGCARDGGASERASPSESGPPRVVISAERVGDRQALENVDAEHKVRYEELPEQKQEEFRRALSGEDVESTEWNTQPLYVEYEGAWYSVTVTIIQ